MKKYNRLCVSISDENNSRLDSIVSNTNKKIKVVTKSAIVDMALNSFFETANADLIASELSKQIMVD